MATQKQDKQIRYLWNKQNKQTNKKNFKKGKEKTENIKQLYSNPTLLSTSVITVFLMLAKILKSPRLSHSAIPTTFRAMWHYVCYGINFYLLYLISKKCKQSCYINLVHLCSEFFLTSEVPCQKMILIYFADLSWTEFVGNYVLTKGRCPLQGKNQQLQLHRYLLSSPSMKKK